MAQRRSDRVVCRRSNCTRACGPATRSGGGFGLLISQRGGWGVLYVLYMHCLEWWVIHYIIIQSRQLTTFNVLGQTHRFPGDKRLAVASPKMHTTPPHQTEHAYFSTSLRHVCQLLFSFYECQ